MGETHGQSFVSEGEPTPRRGFDTGPTCRMPDLHSGTSRWSTRQDGAVGNSEGKGREA